MKSLILVLGLVSACLLWTGCSKSENGPDKPSGGGTEIVQKIPLAISTTITKVLNDSFEVGDAIGLYVVNAISNGSSGWNSGSLMNTGNHLSNVKFSYESGVWKSQQEYYWKDASTPADFYCYYPYQASVGNVASVSLTLPSDQSSEQAFKAAEVLWGKSELQSPSDNKVSITTTHRTSQIIIRILPGKGFDEQSLKESLKSVKINNIKCSCSLNLKDGSLSAEGEVLAERVSVAIYSVAGKRMLQKAVRLSSDTSGISLSSLPAGVYVVQTTSVTPGFTGSCVFRK